MTEKARKVVALASLGIALLSLEVVTITRAAPGAAALLEGERGRTLLNAAGVALRTVSRAAGEAASEAAGTVLIRALRGATEAYGIMLSLMPAANSAPRRAEGPRRSESGRASCAPRESGVWEVSGPARVPAACSSTI